MAVWRAGVTGAVGEDAVDGTLLASEELAQRCALSTSPSHNRLLEEERQQLDLRNRTSGPQRRVHVT